MRSLLSLAVLVSAVSVVTPARADDGDDELRMAGAGLGLFALSYTPMLAAATIGSSESVKDCDRRPVSLCPNTLEPLFVPVVGPFWMLGRLDGTPNQNETAAIGLVVDGLAQAVGLGALGYGLVAGVGARFVVASHGKSEIAVGPMHGAGLGLTGTF